MMPSPRRLRLLMMAVLGTLITILFFTSKMRQTTPQDTRTIQDFYHKTMNAMDHPRGAGQVVGGGKGSTSDPHVKDKDGDGSIGEDDEKLAKEMTDRLRAAEQKAKDLANKKAPLKPDSPQKVVGVGSAAGGQGKKGKNRVGSTAEDDDATEADLELDLTLEEIFKKSPGMSLGPPTSYLFLCCKLTRLLFSDYFLKVILSVLEACQGHSSREILHRPAPLRCRTR